MKDIDFDELDRAVSSVLSQNTAKDTPAAQEEPVKEEAEQKPTLSMAAEEPVATITDEPEASAGDTLQPTKPTPLAIKRRGKFMDVMHPSADMQPSAPAPDPVTRVARTAPVITPLLPEEAESAHHEAVEPVADLDESAALIGAAPAQVESELEAVDTTAVDIVAETEETAQADEAPNTDSSVDVDDEPTATDAVGAEAETEAPEGDAAAETPQEEPQSTPFLSDTQVEKRPLGAFGEAEAPADASGDMPNDNPVEELKPAAAPAALPRELQPDVVNVESVQEAEAEQAAASAGGASDTLANPFAAKVGVAPDASDGRVEGHPLFDTSTYHEPIAAVHSHGMPGWAKWSLGLLACLAVGAGVGYFLFAAGL